MRDEMLRELIALNVGATLGLEHLNNAENEAVIFREYTSGLLPKVMHSLNSKEA